MQNEAEEKASIKENIFLGYLKTVWAIFPAPIAWTVLQGTLIPVAWVGDQIEMIKYRKEEAKYVKAARWIEERLRERGIIVTMARGGDKRLEIMAEVSPEQTEKYRSVITEAVVRFPYVFDCTGHLKNLWFSPAEPLGREWADVHGFLDFAEEVFTPPCLDCGKPESKGYRFGRGSVDYLRTHYAGLGYRITYKDGTQRKVPGHICEACLNAKAWSSFGSWPKDRPDF